MNITVVTCCVTWLCPVGLGSEITPQGWSLHPTSSEAGGGGEGGCGLPEALLVRGPRAGLRLCGWGTGLTAAQGRRELLHSEGQLCIVTQSQSQFGV